MNRSPFPRTLNGRCRSASKPESINSVIRPYGYGRDENGMMVINPEEAKHVRQIFDWALSGIGTFKIAHMLEEQGVPTRKGALGQHQQLRVFSRTRNTMVQQSDASAVLSETEALLRFSDSAGMQTEFSEQLFASFVERIIVYTRKSVGFKLKCGLTLKEELCTDTK